MTTEHKHTWLPYVYKATGKSHHSPEVWQLRELTLREVICVDCGETRNTVEAHKAWHRAHRGHMPS